MSKKLIKSNDRRVSRDRKSIDRHTLRKIHRELYELNELHFFIDMILEETIKKKYPDVSSANSIISSLLSSGRIEKLGYSYRVNKPYPVLTIHKEDNDENNILYHSVGAMTNVNTSE